MRSLQDRIVRATEGAPGTVVILSANPMHDTGGGQRSAQLALELLENGYAVVFVSHGRVTETVDLGVRFSLPRLVETSLRSFTGPSGVKARAHLWDRGVTSVVTQVPVRAWLPVLERAARSGAVTIYDCVDRWDSELGRGWYRPEVEGRIARQADLVVASAPDLVRRLELMAEREVHLVPNAFNGRVFDAQACHERPADLPDGRVALYVGALWGGWFDWDLVGRAARAWPETSFVFIGDYRNEGAGLPSNCRFLGLKPQVALPPYLAHADVAMIPWVRDEVTHATSPLKVYEFVAMGLPVVAPRLDPLTGIPGVRLVDGSDEFVRAVGEVDRASVSSETGLRMEEFSAENSWARRVEQLGGLVRRARAGAVLGGGPSAWPRSRAVLSVVVPSYNHERYLGRALDSVRRQSLPAGDLVVVDDGSTDGSRDVLSALACARTRVVHQDNRGAHEAINRAVALSDGDYVAILNSDDFFHEGRLEHAWGVARASGAALVLGGVRWVDEDDVPLADDHPGVSWYREALHEARVARSLRRAILKHNVAVTTSNFFFHRSLWRALEGFRPYRYVHDMDFLVRALELCPDRVEFVPDMVDVSYRVHGGNTISESAERALSERSALVRSLKDPSGRVKRWVGGARARARVRDAVRVTRDLSPGEDLGSSEARGADASPPARPGARALRVGLVVRSLGIGGLEEIVALLARALPRHGIATSVLCTHAGGPIAGRLVDAGIPVFAADGRPDRWRGWMGSAAPDVISTHFAPLEVVEVLSERGTPIVETVQNTYAWFAEEDWEREALKVRLLAGTVAVSAIVARYHAVRTGSRVTPWIVPNAVDPARAAVVPRAWARRRLGVDEHQPLFVHHGRVARQKNLVGLVRAFAELRRAHPEARLVLAGPGSERRYLREVRAADPRAFGTGVITLLPPVPHAGAFLSAADAYVSNSFFEGWSVAASEAAWVGVPLVLSDCGGARELLAIDGVRGRLVRNPLGDPLSIGPELLRRPLEDTMRANEGALVEALREVLGARDSRALHPTESPGAAREHLGPERMAGAYAAVFRSLVARHD